MVVNVFDVDDVFWKTVTDQQLRQDASYEKKIAFLFVHWKEWDKPNPSQFIDYTKINNKVRRSFPVQPPTVGYHLSGVKGHSRNVVGIFDENKFRFAWNVLVRDGSIIQQEETPKERLHTGDRDKSPLAIGLHRPYGKYYYYDDVMDDGVTDNDGDITMQVDDDGGVLIAAPGMAPLVVPSRDDIGGELSDAPAPGVAPPVNPDSAVAMEVDNQDVAVSRHAEQRAPEDSEDHGSSFHPEDISDHDASISSEVEERVDDAPSLAAAALRHSSDDDASAPSLHDASIASEDDGSSFHSEDNSDHDVVIPPEVEERVDDVVPRVPLDNPIYRTALDGETFMVDRMERILHQYDDYDIRNNERGRGGIVTPPSISIDRYGQIPIADLKDNKGNMDHALLLDHHMKMQRNPDNIPLAMKNTILKAIRFHITILGKRDEQLQLSRKDLFIRYKSRGFERHHIIPRSCEGGNERENLVYLSKTDHIKVHGHLAVMCNDPILPKIFCFMTSSRRCAGLTETMDQVQQLLNDEGLLEVLAISRSIYSIFLKNTHAKRKNGDDLNEYETMVRETCSSLFFFNYHSLLVTVQSLTTIDFDLFFLKLFTHLYFVIRLWLHGNGDRNWEPKGEQHPLQETASAFLNGSGVVTCDSKL